MNHTYYQVFLLKYKSIKRKTVFPSDKTTHSLKGRQSQESLIQSTWSYILTSQTKLPKFLNNIIIPLLKKQVHNPTGVKSQSGASLVAQWLRICLPMQGKIGRASCRERV